MKMKCMNIAILSILLFSFSNTYASMIFTDATWQQSFDGVLWNPADVKEDREDGVSDVLWPSEIGQISTVYFRKIFYLDEIPTYSSIHFSSSYTYEIFVNNVSAFSYEGPHNTSGGRDVTDKIRLGENIISAACTPYSISQALSGGFSVRLNLEGVSPVSETDPVPEPTTMLLFGVGLLGIASLSRKSNKTAPDIA